MAERLAKLPEVGRVHDAWTLSFRPDQDAEARADPAGRAQRSSRAFKAQPRPAPTDAETIAALNRGVEAADRAAGDQTGPGAEAAKRLAPTLPTSPRASQALRERAADASSVCRSRSRSTACAIAAGAADHRREPAAGDRRGTGSRPTAAPASRSHPKGDPNDNEMLRQFARAVLAVEPNASGGPISILESGDTVVRAFIEAGIWALVSIAILLWIVLRRFSDVLLTLIPLLLAGVVTLEICVLIGLPLNFANIIALPLLLGVGVAFKIYYIMAWRAGQTDLLQSSLTRAVIFSALTTATAFGSLWLSSHPGTSSMGKLLALSLVCTLAAAVLFQPVLMGPPRAESPKRDGAARRHTQPAVAARTARSPQRQLRRQLNTQWIACRSSFSAAFFDACGNLTRNKHASMK